MNFDVPMEDTMPDDVAVLIGNGLSIAQNKSLALPALTADIRKRISQHRNNNALNDPAKIMSDMAAKAHTGDADADFEALLGPLDLMAEGLEYLDPLSQIMSAAPDQVSESIRTTTAFVGAVRRLGLGHVLQVIAEHSYASFDSRDVIENFIEAVYAGCGGRITLANLNYDLLVHAVLSEQYHDVFCDMAKGYDRKTFEVVPGHYAQASPLRTEPNYPNRAQITLLHLHGSLTWLRGPDGIVYRFLKQDLENAGYFKALREGTTAWTPEVVLTNQTRKSSIVAQQPFALAYESFEERLRSSDRWLLVGYSFKDECVNAVLARVLATRADNPPKVLVVTMGDEPTDIAVWLALNWFLVSHTHKGDDWLRILRSGVQTMTSTREWLDWSVGRWYALPASA